MSPVMNHYKVLWCCAWYQSAPVSTIIAAESKEQVKRLWREAYDVVPRDIKQLEVKP